MKAINYQMLKRVTYMGLTLSSMVFSSEVQAKYTRDYDVYEGENLVGPKSSIFREVPDEVQRDIKRPERGSAYRNYDELRNEIIGRYEKYRPELSQYKRNARPKAQDRGLVSDAKAFEEASLALREKMKERNGQVTQIGKKVADGIGALSEIVINETVGNEKSRTLLVRFKDEFVQTLKGLFDL